MKKALPLNIAKKYVAMGKNRPSWLVDKLNELFDNQQRIYIPVPDSDFSIGDTEKEVKEFLTSIGYSIKDYKLGIAFQTDNPKREIRIGKLLNKENQSELLNKFQVDINRTLAKQQTKYSIVICQHPYDITAMATGREWTSCLEVLAGKFGHYIPKEIERGTLTVYFINSNDRNINEPRGRVNIKLYSTDADEDIYGRKTFPADWVWVPDTRYYGAFPPEGREVLMEWLLSNQEYENEINYYKLDNLYNFEGTAWKVKLKTDKEEGLLEVISIQSATDEYDYEDEDDYYDDEDYSSQTYWEGTGAFRPIQNFLNYTSGEATVINFDANRDGIHKYEVEVSDLVMDSESVKALSDVELYFNISKIYDRVEFNFSVCSNYNLLLNYTNYNDLVIDGELILTDETSKRRDCHLYQSHKMDRELRSRLIGSMKEKNYIELINCDRNSVKETLDVYKSDADTTIELYINDCPDYLEYLKSLNSIEELEPYELEFLCRVGEKDVNKEKQTNVYFSNMDFSGIKIYEEVIEKYSEILKIEDIFECYSISENMLNTTLLNDSLFDVDSNIGISKFKYREVFDKLDLVGFSIQNEINLMQVDLSTLPKAKTLRLNQSNNKNLEGLRQKTYERIVVMSCRNFTSFKGLSLVDMNIQDGLSFNKINIKDWTFFDELYSIYPKFLNYLKSNVNNTRKNSFEITEESNELTTTLKWTVLYSDIIKHLEKMSDDDWYKTEEGITQFLNVVLDRSGRWKMNKNGEVDVDGSVFMRAKKVALKLNGKIPIKFGKVTGSFDCSENNLTTLENCPTFVGGNFSCSFNKLTSLEFMPSGIGGNFDCKNNLLTNLKGMENVEMGGLNATFDCVKNQLTSLEGMTDKVQKSITLIVAGNNLTSFKGLEVIPEISTLQADENNLTSLDGIPKKINFAIFIRNQKSGKVFTMSEVTNLVDIKDIWSMSNIVIF